jgi:hypothetical protein
MTDGITKVLLWNVEKKNTGAWATRDAKAHECISQLLACLFRDKMQGTKLPQVREMMKFALSPAKSSEMRKYIKVKI